MRTMILTAALAALVAVSASAQSRDVDLEAADGVTLKATYTSPGQPGPGMLLVHQCNMDRTSWNDIAAELVGAGVHVLTLDLRGFGDSGGEGIGAGFPAFLQTSSADVDMAYDYLAAQSGVDASRIGAGGASCGAMLTADLAARREVEALMLLSGPPSEAAVANMAGDGGLGGVRGGGDRGSGDRRGRRRAAGRRRRVVSSPLHREDLPRHRARAADVREERRPRACALLAWLKGELLGN